MKKRARKSPVRVHAAATDDVMYSLMHAAGAVERRLGRRNDGVTEALAHFGRRLLGHQQITDAYLLGLAIQKKGRLATLDASLSSLLSEQSATRNRLVLL